MVQNFSKSTSLAPGFRFHPTDEELVWYYLKRKVSGKPFRVDAISEIDIYKVEPSDLPGLSKLKTRDQEWYFFSALDRKYGNGSRTNRATNEGYWKTTGKDRPVYHRSQVVGMKKTLVYHKGRAPRGERSNWVMHEYKLNDDVLGDAGFSPDGFVLCRVFQKSGTGPKNGEQYGAPLVEEEWEDSGEVVVPSEVSFEDPYVDDDAYIEQNDLNQVSLLSENIPLPVSFDHADINNCLEGSQHMPTNDLQSVEEFEDKYSLEALDDQKFYVDMHDGSNAFVVKNEHMVQPNDSSNEDPVNLHTLDELLFDATNADSDNGLYFDTNLPDFDFFESNFDNSDFDIAPYLNDSLFGVMDDKVDEVFFTKQDLIDETSQMSAIQKPPVIGDDGSTSSSCQFMDVSKVKPSKNDMPTPCLSQANWFLKDIPAPSAFASELPSKDVTARLNAAVHSSSSVHLPVGMIRIWDMPSGVNGSGVQLSFDKTGSLNVLLSFDLPHSIYPLGLESLTGMLSKMSAAASRRWLCFTFFLVFLFGLSSKFGTYIYAK